MNSDSLPVGPLVAQQAPPGGGGGIAVVLYHPLIPNNTGNISRTCVATGTPLYLIRPFPFSLEESRLRRAGLDYWPHLHLGIHEDLTSLEAGGRLVFVSRKGATNLHDFVFSEGDRLVFGPEDKGFSPEMLVGQESVYLPMYGRVRSLNLSNCVAVALFHALAVLGRPGGPGDPENPGPARQPKPDDGGIAGDARREP
jgi:tRNA (cytidine/uridine-2'-O-)-methyltransferase